jgi:hypothetical protein
MVEGTMEEDLSAKDISEEEKLPLKGIEACMWTICLELGVWFEDAELDIWIQRELEIEGRAMFYKAMAVYRRSTIDLSILLGTRADDRL